MGYTSAEFSPENLRKQIGEKFNGSVAFFARGVDVQPQTVWKWLKTGRMDPEKLQRCAQILGVTVDVLRTPPTTEMVEMPVRLVNDLRFIAGKRSIVEYLVEHVRLYGGSERESTGEKKKPRTPKRSRVSGSGRRLHAG